MLPPSLVTRTISFKNVSSLVVRIHFFHIGYFKDGNRSLYTVDLLDDGPETIDNLNGIIDSVLILAKRLGQDDPEAIQIMFNLLLISDGAVSEAIHIQLGQIIKRNPKLFLELSPIFTEINRP